METRTLTPARFITEGENDNISPQSNSVHCPNQSNLTSPLLHQQINENTDNDYNHTSQQRDQKISFTSNLANESTLPAEGDAAEDALLGDASQKLHSESLERRSFAIPKFSPLTRFRSRQNSSTDRQAKQQQVLQISFFELVCIRGICLLFDKRS